jgi:hypothetical protein
VCVNNGRLRSYRSHHSGFRHVHPARLTQRHIKFKWSPSSPVFSLKFWIGAAPASLLSSWLGPEIPHIVALQTNVMI